MKKLLALLLLLPALAFAGSAILQWTVSPTAGVDSYSVYSTYTRGTYLTAPIFVGNALTYTDSTSVVGECYVVRAIMGGIESDNSNELCFGKPLPPGLLRGVWSK